MPAGAWRILALAAVVGAALAAPASPSALEGGDARTSRADALAELEHGVLAEINDLRRSRGLVPLRLSPPLGAAAQRHSQAMARHGFFRHDSRDGSAFWRRIERYYPSDGHRYWAVGENLLWSSPDVDAERAVEMWLASPTHRRVLLTPRWREVGLAAVHAPDAPGVFGEREVTILTADFGVRR